MPENLSGHRDATGRPGENPDAGFVPFPCGKNGEEFPSIEITVGGMPPRELGEKVIQSFTSVSDSARSHLIVPEDTAGYFGKGLRSTFAHPRTFREVCLTVGQIASVKRPFLEKETRKGAVFAEPGKSIDYHEGKLTLTDLRFIPPKFLRPETQERDLFQKWGDANLGDANELERNSFETAAYLMLKERRRDVLIPAVDPSSMGVFSVTNYHPTGERHLDYIYDQVESFDRTQEVALLLRGRGGPSLFDMYYEGWYFKDPKETLGQPRVFQQFLDTTLYR